MVRLSLLFAFEVRLISYSCLGFFLFVGTFIAECSAVVWPNDCEYSSRSHSKSQEMKRFVMGWLPERDWREDQLEEAMQEVEPLPPKQVVRIRLGGSQPLGSYSVCYTCLF